MKEQRFSDLKQAQLEAWLTDGYALEEGNKAYVVLSLSDTKERIKSLVSAERYDAAREISETLRKPIQLVPDERSKSIRIPFSVYINLVDEALKEGITLSDAVKKRVVSDLKLAIMTLSSRNDINKEKLSLMKKTLDDWMGIKEIESSKSKSYTPSFRRPEKAPTKALIQLLIETEAVRHSKDIPPETLKEVLTTAEVDESEPFFDISIYRDQQSGLRIDLYFSIPFVIQGSLEEDFNYDPETIFQLKELFEELHPEYLMYSPVVDIFSLDLGNKLVHEVKPRERGPLDILAAQLAGQYLNPIQLLMMYPFRNKSMEEQLSEKVAEKDAIYEKLNRQLKDQVYGALNSNDVARVAELTRVLEAAQREREIVRFASQSIMDLVKTSQVVSFKAPEVLIRAWEVYGNLDLEDRLEK